MRRTLSCLKSVPNRQDKFLFDLNGYIHIKNALSTTEIDSMNTAITQHQEKQVIRSDAKLKNAVSGSGMAAEGSRIDMGGMMGWEGEHGAIFRQMLCHPNIAPYLNAFLGKGSSLNIPTR